MLITLPKIYFRDTQISNLQIVPVTLAKTNNFFRAYKYFFKFLLRTRLVNNLSAQV